MAAEPLAAMRLPMVGLGAVERPWLAPWRMRWQSGAGPETDAAEPSDILQGASKRWPRDR